MRRRLVALVAMVLTAVPLAACSGSGSGVDRARDGGEFKDLVTEYAPADRGEPISFSGTTLEGDPISFADYRGQVTVVNVWWSGCGPCLAEMPMLAKAATDLEGSATIVGVNTQDASADNGLAFEQNAGVSYPSFYSPDGQVLLAFPADRSPRSVPGTLVLDQQGRIAALINGQIPTEQTLDDVVDKVVTDG